MYDAPDDPPGTPPSDPDPTARRDGEPILTLEPLLEAVREAVEEAGWGVSGLQKTTSHEFEGRWAGASTRSAYLFAHRDDLPDSVSLEGFLDETGQGLRGNLTLVVEGPRYGELGGASLVLERVAEAVGETVPPGLRVPLSLRLHLSDPARPPREAEVQLRLRTHLPNEAAGQGAGAVRRLVRQAVAAFEELLERPEVAELLPPVMD